MEIHDDLPDEILEILSHKNKEKVSNSFPLHEALVLTWRDNLQNGMKKDDLTSLLGKYDIPSNLQTLLPPKLNPEVATILTKTNLMKDGSFVEVQNQIGKGLCALGKGINEILCHSEDIPLEIKKNLLNNFCDTGQILTSVFHRISITRRNMVTPFLNKNLKEVLYKSVPSEFLFGSDLGDNIKAAKAMEIVSKDLKLPSTSSTFSIRKQSKGTEVSTYKPSSKFNLNYQRPSRRVGESASMKGRSSKNNRWDSYKGNQWKNTKEKWKRRE